jgi:hypothetical protein
VLEPELLTQLEGGQGVEVVALGQEQDVAYLLELLLAARDVNADAGVARVEPQLARRDLLRRPSRPDANLHTSRLERPGDQPTPGVPSDDQHRGGATTRDAEATGERCGAEPVEYDRPEDGDEGDRQDVPRPVHAVSWSPNADAVAAATIPRGASHAVKVRSSRPSSDSHVPGRRRAGERRTP